MGRRKSAEGIRAKLMGIKGSFHILATENNWEKQEYRERLFFKAVTAISECEIALNRISQELEGEKAQFLTGDGGLPYKTPS